jgi:RNA polymerase sigma factor (sigma-70 family)
LPVPTALLRLRSDEQLVALFRQGNEDAFRVIHDRYRVRLLAYTRQMLGGSRTDAEDALQDVFLRAYNALRADERPIALKAWLYRVAHNRCIDHIRRPAPKDEDVFDLSRTPAPDLSAQVERRDDLRRLVADVQRLPEQQRSALLMREMEGLSYADLAAALDVSVPAIKSLLVRARIGLVEAAEARDTACAEIREDLAASFDRGVRSSGRAKRHLGECAGCREYRAQLRGVQAGLAALAPVGGPLALLAQLLGIGGLGSAASAGGTAAGAATGGAAVTATTAKVAAVVASAAIAAGGAAEVKHRVDTERGSRGASSAETSGREAAARSVAGRHRGGRRAARRHRRARPRPARRRRAARGQGGRRRRGRRRAGADGGRRPPPSPRTRTCRSARPRRSTSSTRPPSRRRSSARTASTPSRPPSPRRPRERPRPTGP